MSRPLIIGLITEGTTDVRFLRGVIARTFEALIMSESNKMPDIYPIEVIRSIPGTFNESIVHAAKKAEESGITILCVHTDADARTDKASFDNKILPAFQAVMAMNDSVCKNLVPVVPVQMTEAWMLADLELIKEELMTEKSNETLQLNRHAELIANPKEVIKNAINIAQSEVPKRKKQYEVTIAELYLPMGQKIMLDKLKSLPSYQKFVENARNALRVLNFV
jgi:hypothetical protein